MKSSWNDAQAALYSGDLGQRVYSSRLLGADPSLVLYGGGNTSVKVTEPDIFGRPQDLLYVKGSGADLATITAEGFAPVRLDHLIALAKLETLPDGQMANELLTQRTRVNAPTPSVEAILHALLPYKFVDHAHADAIIAITNTPGGQGRIAELYGESVVIIPYVMPGFKLARHIADVVSKHAHRQTLGLILLNHGVVTFGNSARESYERMITLVDKAEHYLRDHHAWSVTRGAPPPPPPP
jgi:rhamnose utilization protein RhaD (predicted bifunctional aldolase and dehydrogenase)